MRRAILLLCILVAAAGSLSACGKKGSPEAPGQSDYPRRYPAER